MEKSSAQSPLDRIKSAGVDPDMIARTKTTFDHWRQVLDAINDQDLGKVDLNTVYKRPLDQ